ncbi:MAG: nucleoside-diphosphate sugar epimerase/dehydratase [Actinomycetota bacterium]|nr:nucleoside-diphosphate sugar epimerase/dehydratase [Actinomycetota bacterium]
MNGNTHVIRPGAVQTVALHILKLAARAGIRIAAVVGGYMLATGNALGLNALMISVDRSWPYALAFAGLGFVLDRLFRTDRQLWRYISVVDVLPIVRTSTLLVFIFLVTVFFVDRAATLPRSTLFIVWVLDIGLTLALSLARRIAYDKEVLGGIAPFLSAREHRTPLLLVGDLDRADLFLRDIGKGSSPYRPLGILAHDSAPALRQEVRGVCVIPDVARALDMIDDLIAHGRDASVVFLDSGRSPVDFGTERLGQLRNAGVKFLRMPSLVEMGHRGGAGSMREFALEELLARPPVRLDEERLKALISGRRVLVTGAGGSIGSEICRQVASLGCAHLAMIDNSEFSLFKIDVEISDRWPTLSKREYLRDIRQADRLTSCFDVEQPEIIFHAAALKHVPMMERHPSDAALTNIVGTWNVAQAASAVGARQMVFISTDKAVDPPNVMGATKRLAEAVVRAQQGNSSGTRFSAVRFGNVLGSAGSVVPTFRAQIERGGPVTLTHPEIERYFMTIPEAVQLVLHATAITAQQEDAPLGVYVLDMGKPVKIMDLAKQLIELSGKEPGRDIAIEITGLRPGEKLYEELVDSTEQAEPCGESLMRVTDRLKGATLTSKIVNQFDELARAGDDQAVRELIFRILGQVRTAPSGGIAQVVPIKRGDRPQ